eukprot:m.97670 g.97670  ORF g.97670 m.97670 type:complete len:433 (-) comp16722_c0_seq1:289-1587(-)
MMPSLRRDADGLGGSRRAGGGNVGGGFLDTLGMPRVDNRDPALRRQQAAVRDFRHAARMPHHGVKSETKLLNFASNVTSRAAFNRTAHPKPDLKRDLRGETNATIQAHNRRSRAVVLRLAHAEAAGAAELSALAGTHARLVRALEEPERMIWQADQSLSKRNMQCIPNERNDAIGPNQYAIREERQVAMKWRDEILDRTTSTKKLLNGFARCQQDLQKCLKERKKGNDLNPDTYSGVVAQFPVPTDDDPPQLIALARAFESSQTHRNDAAAFLSLCAEDLAKSRSNLDRAMKAAVKQSRDLERELVLAKGHTRLALNRTKRDLHLLTIRDGVNSGAAEGAAYVRTSERVDRPLVRAYHRTTGSIAGAVTRHETSEDNGDMFVSSQRVAADDTAELHMTARALSATLHDRSINRSVDEDIARFRTRLHPSRRP